jgi:membrane fusion protein (multidrug efflux system)
VTALRKETLEESPASAPRAEARDRIGIEEDLARGRDHSGSSRRRRIRWLLIGLGPLLAIVVGSWFYFTSGRYSSTDDAFVKTDLVSISPQVPGQVAAVYVQNNQRVQAGQVLFDLDSASYRIALDQAEANLASVRDQIAALRANYHEKAAALISAQQTAAYQQHEYDRAANLRKTSAVSEQQFDQVRHNLEQAQQNVVAVQQQMAAIAAQLGGDVNTPIEALAQYRAALARRDDAQVSLDRTKIKAPADGVVANVSLRPGDYITAGQSVFSLAEIDHVWIAGNFKETDLTHVVAGQPATVTVDTYPGVAWKATVESVSPASGNEFSVLPAENSSGNWVKVVQRIPVRLKLEQQPDAPQLRAGMSVYATIDTGPHGRIATLLARIGSALHIG